MQINNEDVRQASHEQVVNLIRKSGDLVSLTVVTVLPRFLTGALGTVTACETASANASPSMSVNSATNLNNNPGLTITQFHLSVSLLMVKEIPFLVQDCQEFRGTDHDLALFVALRTAEKQGKR